MSESWANTALKNGVRVGDRSRMHIVPASRAGTRALPSTSRFARAKPGTSRAARPAARSSKTDWFWASFSPSRTTARAGRYGLALAAVTARPAPIINRGTLSTVAQTFKTEIDRAARKHRLSPALLAAVIAVESAGRPRAVSHAGAQGLMQLMPPTARRFGVRNSFDPAQNVMGGAAYLSWLLNRFDGDIILALAGYNAGEGAVDKHHGVPPYRETRAYVVKVLDALAGTSALCREAPIGPRQACAWRV